MENVAEIYKYVHEMVLICSSKYNFSIICDTDPYIPQIFILSISLRITSVEHTTDIRKANTFFSSVKNVISMAHKKPKQIKNVQHR